MPAHLSLRDKVNIAEQWMLQQPQLELTVKHHFSPGVYARELFIPAGTMLTGAIHKYEQLNIMSAGTMLLVTDDGCIEVSAPFTIVSPPGTKRIAYAQTDCVWTTILGTDETDVPKIEAHFTAKSEAEYQAFLVGPDVLKDLEWHS